VQRGLGVVASESVGGGVATAKRAIAPGVRPRARPASSASRSSRRTAAARRARARWLRRSGELLLEGGVVAVTCLAVLGRFGQIASPAFLVAGFVVATIGSVVAVVAIERARRSATGFWRHFVDFACIAVFGGVVWLAPPLEMLHSLQDLLADERATQLGVVRHQIYAAYRRMDLKGQNTILERARVFEPTIAEAAKAFGVDRELMVGIAATESSFNPRPSRDGGRGLFQITAVPAEAEAAAKKALGTDSLDPLNQRHNAFVAAATLRVYARQMDGDLLLTLLAYNIGPQNGGLNFILEKYGAQNFAQAQPYLQEMPRDYPIRVLSAALAYRLWRELGRLPRYEEGDSARRIQRLGVPGLDGPAPFGEAVEGVAASR